MALKILITNDDGIYSEGIRLLVNEVKKIAPNAEILVVAPKTEQSAKSHGIILRKEMEVQKIDIFGDVISYYVDSTPADCVRYAYYGLKYDYDILLSGINKGYNVGYDIMYSGTVAAAFEASSTNKLAIALSSNHTNFDGALSYLPKVYDFFKRNELLKKWNLYNINFPVSPQGIKITEQGVCNFTTFYIDSEKGKIQEGEDITDERIENIHLDTACVRNGYVSITPLTHVRTEKEVYKKIKDCK